MTSEKIEYKTLRIHKKDWKKLKTIAMEQDKTVVDLISEMTDRL